MRGSTMSTALSDAYPPPGGWTTDDLDAMPDDGRAANCWTEF